MNKLKVALEQDTYAVVGASTTKSKYGYKVFKTLTDYDDNIVYPVNPKAEEIDGVKCYDQLADIPEQIDVAVTVVPPKVTKKIVEQVADLKIDFLWMQPGSEFDNAKEQGAKRGIDVITDDCIMVQMRRKHNN